MPVSPTQYRASVGSNQNRLLNNGMGSVTTKDQRIQSGSSTEMERIQRFGRDVHRVANSHHELARTSAQATVSPQSLAVPLLILLSQVRLSDSSLTDDCPTSALSGQHDLTLPQEECTLLGQMSDYVKSGLTMVEDTWYSIDDLIKRHDPLKFPAAEGAISMDWAQTIDPSDVKMVIDRGRFLTGELARKASDLVQTVKNKEDLLALDEVVNKLNRIVYESEDAYPSKSHKVINVDRLIYVIEKSEQIISEFEVKSDQDDFCKQLRLQLGNYVKDGVELKDRESALKFKKFMEKTPEIKFDPDKRGRAYPTVEEGIADSLIRSVFWFENDNEYSATSGLRFQAHKFILASVLAEKGINDTSKLHEDWYKGDGALKLYNILYRDLEYNLKNRGKSYLFGAARLFFSEYCSSNSAENITGIRGLEKKALSSYTDKDKLTLLMHYFNQPVDVESSQNLKIGRFLKMVDFVMLLQTITDFIRPEEAIEQREGYTSSEQATGSGTIYGRQSESRFQNFKLKFNHKNNQLSVIPTRRMGLKKQAALMGRNRKVLSRNNIKSIKFASRRRDVITRVPPPVTKSVRKRITPEMIEKNFDPKKITGQNDIGLMLHENGKKYLKINNSYVEVKANNGHLYIKKEKGNLNIEYRKGKINLESYRTRLARIKETGLSGRVLTPHKIISDTLNISEDDAKSILSNYEFPEGSDLYTEGTFALSVRDTGRLPEWAESFKKIKAEDYPSPYVNNHMMDNGLLGFQGKSGYFYRVDYNRPEIVLEKGFDESKEFIAIPKLLPAEMPGVIFSESLEGARRYQLLSKDSYLYQIEGEGLEGVSLKDNLYKNQKGLNEFLGVPLGKRYTTIDSFAEDSNGAIYLDEVHIKKGTIRPSKITVVDVDQINQDLLPGPWERY